MKKKKKRKKKDKRTLCNLKDKKEMALWMKIAKAALKPGIEPDV